MAGGTGVPSDWSSLRSLHSGIVGTNQIWRLRLKRLLDSDVAALFSVVAVLFSVALVVTETDKAASGLETPVWVHVANFSLLLVFLAELACRAFVDRSRFFYSSMNLLDGSIVAADLARLAIDTQFGSALLALRSVRLLRIGRALSIMLYIPELANMVRGMVGAFKALFWGCFLLAALLCVWGILATQFIHPLNQELTRQGVWDEAGCGRCPRAFETVLDSMYTFTQQVVAGDSWGLLTLPLMERYPATVLFFVPVLCSVQLAMINLILAAVLDKAAESRKQSEQELLTCKMAEEQHAKADFITLCRDLDDDQDGALTFPEFLRGFDEQLDFKAAMESMDIRREDLHIVFRLMDSDNSGSVDYKEFADQVFKMRSNNLHTMVVFINFYVAEIWEKIRSDRRHRPGRRGSLASNTGIRPTKETEALPGGRASLAFSSDSHPGQAEVLTGALAQCPGQVEQKTGAVPASAWADKVNEALPQAEEKLPQRLDAGDELARSRQGIEEALRSISEKLLTQTKVLEALPTLMARDRTVGRIGALPEIGARAELAEGPPPRPRPSERSRRGCEVPSTRFCCQPSREERPSRC